MQTIKVRQTRHAGHCWISRDELISDVFLWTPSHGRAKAGWQARTYIQQLCEDTGCSPEDLPEVMNDREEWRERIRDIHADGTRWWWWIIKKMIFSLYADSIKFANWTGNCFVLSDYYLCIAIMKISWWCTIFVVLSNLQIWQF